MKRIIALLTVTTLLACGRDKNRPNVREGQERPQHTQAAAPAYKPVFPEAEAVAVLRAISDAEVATAGVALQVTQSESVVAYSRVIASDYRGIAQLLDSAAMTAGQPPRDNQLSLQLRTEGDSMATALRSLPRGFNNTYIEEQVKAHQATLQLMDTALIPSTRTPQIRNLMIAIRPTIVAHLQRSLQILSERKQAAEEKGIPWESGFNATPPSGGAVFSPPSVDSATPPANRDTARPQQPRESNHPAEREHSERPSRRDSDSGTGREATPSHDRNSEPPKLLGQPVGQD